MPEKAASDAPAKRELPIMGLVIILVLIAVVFGFFSLFTKPKARAEGVIVQAGAVQMQDNSVLVAVSVRITNTGKRKFQISSVKAELETDQGKFDDDAASVVDFERYFQAFPDLRQYGADPLKPDSSAPPGGQLTGTVIVSFPVTKEQFDKRRSLSVRVVPYDQPPLTVKQ